MNWREFHEYFFQAFFKAFNESEAPSILDVI